jgi:hypothetical protein
MNIELNQKNQQRIKNLLAQRDQVMQALNETIILILDAKDVNYTDMSVDLSEDMKNIILTEKEKEHE